MTAVEDFQSETETLAATVQRHVLMLYAAYLAGSFPSRTSCRSSSPPSTKPPRRPCFGDVWLVAQIEERTGAAALATGVPPTDDADRLTKAVSTVLAERDSASLSNLEPDPTVTPWTTGAVGDVRGRPERDVAGDAATTPSRGMGPADGGRQVSAL